MPEPLNSFTAIYTDPALISCTCPRCARGQMCDWMADLWDTHNRQRAYEQACAALTPADRAWLTEHGWPDGTPLSP